MYLYISLDLCCVVNRNGWRAILKTFGSWNRRSGSRDGFQECATVVVRSAELCLCRQFQETHHAPAQTFGQRGYWCQGDSWGGAFQVLWKVSYDRCINCQCGPWDNIIKQVEAQLDCGPGSEIRVGWKIRVMWSRKRGFKMVATEHGYLLTKLSFWLRLYYDVIYQFLGMEAKNYKFGLFCQLAIHPWPQVMPIFDRKMPPGFTPALCLHRNFVCMSILDKWGHKSVNQNF